MPPAQRRGRWPSSAPCRATARPACSWLLQRATKPPTRRRSRRLGCDRDVQPVLLAVRLRLRGCLAYQVGRVDGRRSALAGQHEEDQADCRDDAPATDDPSPSPANGDSWPMKSSVGRGANGGRLPMPARRAAGRRSTALRSTGSPSKVEPPLGARATFSPRFASPPGPGSAPKRCRDGVASGGGWVIWATISCPRWRSNPARGQSLAPQQTAECDLGASRRRRNPVLQPGFTLRMWLRGTDSNRRPSGYEPDELPLLHPAREE